MGFDRHRVMEVFAGAENGGGRVGSGYRVAEGLVLTAGHVVAGLTAHPHGELSAAGYRAKCEVRPLGARAWITGSVLWRDEAADVALIGLASDAPPLPPGSPVPLWGMVDGDQPVSCSAVGFPWAQEQPDRARDTEQLVGFVPPLSTAKGGHLSLTVVSSKPTAREHGSPWAGMSGAAVFAGPYLVGIVIVNPARFGEDRLVVAAVSALCQNTQFAELAGVDGTALKSVQPRFRLAVSQDLSVLLQPPYRPLLPADLTFARAPVRLLLPEHGVVPFLGREESLTELQDWCFSSGQFGLRIVTGDGGTGKTRLAAELAARLMTDGWDAGFSDSGSPGGATHLEPERPTLLIVDEADSDVMLVSSLIATFATQPGGPPFRLLLLARQKGAWWQQLNRRTQDLAEDLAAETIALQAGELGPDEQQRHYEIACAAFAAQLERSAEWTHHGFGCNLAGQQRVRDPAACAHACAAHRIGGHRSGCDAG